MTKFTPDFERRYSWCDRLIAIIAANIKEIQTLLIDMLEEIKINYVKGISEVAVEQLMEETQQLHRSFIPSTKMLQKSFAKKINTIF